MVAGRGVREGIASGFSVVRLRAGERPSSDRRHGCCLLSVICLGVAISDGGAAVYATGSDPEAAFLVGMRPRRVIFSVFAMTGVLTGLAALLRTVQLPQVDPTAGKGLELK